MMIRKNDSGGQQIKLRGTIDALSKLAKDHMAHKGHSTNTSKLSITSSITNSIWASSQPVPPKSHLRNYRIAKRCCCIDHDCINLFIIWPS